MSSDGEEQMVTELYIAVSLGKNSHLIVPRLVQTIMQ